jgi:hypothetical protein
MSKKLLSLMLVLVGSVFIYGEGLKTYVLTQEEVDQRVNQIKENNIERYDYVIKNFDENKDGKISYEEFDKVRNDKEFNESRQSKKQYKNRDNQEKNRANSKNSRKDKIKQRKNLRKNDCNNEGQNRRSEKRMRRNNK